MLRMFPNRAATLCPLSSYDIRPLIPRHNLCNSMGCLNAVQDKGQNHGNDIGHMWGIFVVRLENEQHGRKILLTMRAELGALRHASCF